MSSGIKVDLPSLRSYHQAVAVFAETKKVRGRADYTRPLTKNRSDDAKQLIRYDDAYAVRYHATDIITYRCDGIIHLNPYPSRNTDYMVYEILGLRTRYDSALGQCVIQGHSHMGDEHLYRLSRRACRHGYTIHSTSHHLCDVAQDTQPIERFGINRKVTGALYKAAGIGPFAAWVKVAQKLAPHAFATSYSTTMGDDDLEAITNSEEWPRLAQIYGRQVVTYARMAIIADNPQAVTCTEVPYISRYDEIAVRQAKAQYEDIYYLHAR